MKELMTKKEVKAVSKLATKLNLSVDEFIWTAVDTAMNTGLEDLTVFQATVEQAADRFRRNQIPEWAT